MKKKEYPKNLLSQVFVNGLPTEFPDDVALVLEYIIQKTLTEREGRVLDMRYKRYMTMAAIGEEYGLRAERIRQIEAKAVRKLRHPSRSRYILMGMEGYINYLRDTAVDERLREYKKEIISLEKKIAELTDTEYEEEKNELENAPLAELQPNRQKGDNMNGMLIEEIEKLDRNFLTPAEVSKALGISIATFYRNYKKMKFPTTRVGSRLQIPKEAFLDFLRYGEFTKTEDK